MFFLENAVKMSSATCHPFCSDPNMLYIETINKRGPLNQSLRNEQNNINKIQDLRGTNCLREAKE